MKALCLLCLLVPFLIGCGSPQPDTEGEPERAEDAEDQQAQLARDLERLKADLRLPIYPLRKNVAPELFSLVEKMAAKADLSLLKIEVKQDEEEVMDGVYVMRIGCHYEGTSETVVKFLYVVQSRRDLDLSIHRHKAKPRSPGTIEGAFVIDALYQRKDLSNLPVAP